MPVIDAPAGSDERETRGPSPRAVILLGDPQQLDQPLNGSHPDGVAVSALQHVLGDHETIPAERGIFLEETWRLHPSVCAFTSELFYEGRLRSRAGRGVQSLRGTAPIDARGLWYVPVAHEGNRNCSSEEIEVVSALAPLADLSDFRPAELSDCHPALTRTFRIELHEATGLGLSCVELRRNA